MTNLYTLRGAGDRKSSAEVTRHLDVILCVGPLGIDPGSAVLWLDPVHARGQPHALLAADA